jgi:hypothetical protein
MSFKDLLWVVGGAVVGTAAGVAVAVGIGALSRWQSPNDPSAGSAAIIVVLTAPAGLLLGMIGGCLCGIHWEKRRSKPQGFDVVTKPGGRASR